MAITLATTRRLIQHLERELAQAEKALGCVRAETAMLHEESARVNCVECTKGPLAVLVARQIFVQSTRICVALARLAARESELVASVIGLQRKLEFARERHIQLSQVKQRSEEELDMVERAAASWIGRHASFGQGD